MFGNRGPKLGNTATFVVTLIFFLGVELFHRCSLPLSDRRTSAITSLFVMHSLGRADSRDDEPDYDQRQGNKKACTEGS